MLGQVFPRHLTEKRVRANHESVRADEHSAAQPAEARLGTG